MIRVLVADDHTIVREGLKQILTKSGDLQVAGEAANGNDVLRMVRERAWDVLVTDMSMPGRNGLELIKLVKTAQPKLPVLVLSMYGEEQFAVRAIRAGASGYLNKESASDQLVAAIRKIAGGGVYVSPAVAEALLRTVRDGNTASRQPHEQLSDRELQVLQWIAKGHSVTEIGADPYGRRDAHVLGVPHQDARLQDEEAGPLPVPRFHNSDKTLRELPS